MKTNARRQLAASFEPRASLARRVPWAIVLMCAPGGGAPLAVSAQASDDVRFDTNGVEIWRQAAAIPLGVGRRGVWEVDSWRELAAFFCGYRNCRF